MEKPSLSDLYDALETSHGFPSLTDASVESDSLISSTWKQVVPREEKDVSWTRKSILCENSWMDIGSSEGDPPIYSNPKFTLLKTHLRVFDGNRLTNSYELKDHHGDIYNTQHDSVAQSGSLLAYIAEEKQPSNTPYFQKQSSEEGTQGAEYDYIETFGEQLEGKSRPCLVIFESEAKEKPFKVLTSKAFNDEYYPIAVQFQSKDVLVGIALPINVPYRLGLRYCSNRPSFVFQIHKDGSNFSILHGMSSNSNSYQIRSTKNGDVYWFERSLSQTIYPGPHRTEVDLIGMLGDGKPQVIVSRSDVSFNPDSTPRHIDLNDNTLVLNVVTDGMTACPALIHVKEKRVEVLESAQHVTVHDVGHGLIVGAKSSPLEPWRLVLARGDSQYSFENVMSPSAYQTDRTFKPMQLKSKGGNQFGFNAFYVGPSQVNDDKVPLILIPHGGPHSVSMTSHSSFINYLNILGFGVLVVNYRGSLGSGEESLFGLLGNVGKDDVEDCVQALDECLKSISYLNEEEVYLFGGSHGGFLVTHLAGQAPSRFQGVVALNPVTNISSMVGATDIPDWCFNEAGFPFSFGEPVTPEISKTMWEKSPISHVKNVKAPIYLLIGKDDLRVPPAQGFEYYKALKGLNKEVTISVFRDNHSLAKPAVYKNWMIKIGYFFLKKAKV